MTIAKTIQLYQEFVSEVSAFDLLPFVHFLAKKLKKLLTNAPRYSIFASKIYNN